MRKSKKEKEKIFKKRKNQRKEDNDKIYKTPLSVLYILLLRKRKRKNINTRNS